MSDSPTRILGNSLTNLPWQDRPAGNGSVVWRYSANPVVLRSPIPECNSVFNSAVVPFQDKFAGVFRCDSTSLQQELHVGFSNDGFHWKLDPQAFRFSDSAAQAGKLAYGYDPRLGWVEDRFYITWCTDFHGPTIGIAWTKDFVAFHQLENALLPYNRNGVLFPRRIAEKYHLLSRPSDNSHTPFGDIFLSSSPDMIHWGCHRHVMSRGNSGWQRCKIGAGPVPIETTEGWLMFYHGVLNSCNGFVYSWGAALLDLDEPWKVIRSCRHYLMSPQEIYECVGDVPNVTFPTSALTDAETGRIALYYGCADTVTGLCFCTASEVIEWLKTRGE